MKAAFGVTLCVLLLSFMDSTLALAPQATSSPAIPDAVKQCFATVDLLTVYSLSSGVHPTWLRGDFDGDGIKDYAVFMLDRRTKRRAIVICRTGASLPDIIGHGGRIESELEGILEEVTDWKVAPASDFDFLDEKPQGAVVLSISAKGKWCGGSQVIYRKGNSYALWSEATDCESELDH